MTIHIHQGGTLNVYCGQPLRPPAVAVSWEDSQKATCRDCHAAFEHSENRA